jgi:hypothetical protein
MASMNALLQGPWLDEFWTLELSDSHKGLTSLIRDGWLHDSHPPVFNAWATLLTSLGVTSIPAGRLVSNLLAAGLMIVATWRLSRRMAEQAAFGTILLLLVLSLPEVIEAFATYRSYFWQVAALATLVLIARHVASTQVDLDARKDVDLAVIAALATAASIGLHYIGGLFGGLLAAAIALCARHRGLQRWAVLMFAMTGASSAFIGGSVLVQAPNWATDFDHSWIDLPGLEAMGVPVTLAVGAIIHNPVPLAGLWTRRHKRDGAEWRFLAMVGGVLIAGIVTVLAAHAFKPIVVDRYLIAVPVLVCALMAALAARLALDGMLFALLVLVSVAVAAGPLIHSGIKPKWREGAQTIAAIVADCPTTQVFAASGWALGPAAETRTARREDPVFARAYRLLAERRYAVQFIGQNSAAYATPGACPVLLWFEHTPNEAEDDLPAAVEAAGLTGLQADRLSMTRSATGFVVRADRR